MPDLLDMQDQSLMISPRKVNYMLFIKSPNPGDDKKLKTEKVGIMAL